MVWDSVSLAYIIYTIFYLFKYYISTVLAFGSSYYFAILLYMLFDTI